MTDEVQHNNRFKEIPAAGFFGTLVTKCGSVFAIFILASAGILNFEVILRYVFNSPTIWAHESVIFLTAITFLFGGLISISTDKHIRVVLIYDHLPEKIRRIVNIIISLVSFFATVLFAWAAWLVVGRALWSPDGSFRIETSGSAWNPPAPGLLKAFLFGVLILMAVQFLVLTINYAKKK